MKRPKPRSGVICVAAIVVLALLGVGGRLSQAQASPFDLTKALDSSQAGDTILIPAGTHHGPFTIDKSVTLLGEDWPIIDGGGRGDVITVIAPDVTIQGLILQNSGASLNAENAGITALAPRITVHDNRFENVLFGIYLKDAPESIVRDNVIGGKDLDIARRGDGIRLWYSAGSLVEGNHVSHGRDVVIWFSPNSTIRSNIIEHGRYGLHFMYSDDETIEENVLRYNSVGAFLMYSRRLILRRNLFFHNRGPSGYGLAMKDLDDVVVEGNRSVNNRLGLYLDNTPRSIDAYGTYQNNLFAFNDAGVGLLTLARRNNFSQNIFLDNGTQVAVVGGRALAGNAWHSEGRGNFWSDYVGFDADGDGVGDIPYRSQSVFESLMDAYPELRLFQLSPAVDAIDMAARAFPLFQPRPKMSDEYPLMEPPSLPPVPGLSSYPRLPVVLTALGLLALGGLIVLAGITGDLRWNPLSQ